jgi:hypothetical protein
MIIVNFIKSSSPVADQGSQGSQNFCNCHEPPLLWTSARLQRFRGIKIKHPRPALRGVIGT